MGWKHAVAHDMAGDGDKPKKEISHVVSRKSATPGHVIHEHHHTHPSHHPMEEHVTKGDDELAAHSMATMGTPNPGEDTSDPGSPANAAPAAGAAAPPAAGSGAAAASPMAGM